MTGNLGPLRAYTRDGVLEVSCCPIYGCTARFLGVQALAQHLRAAHHDPEMGVIWGERLDER